jgi:hypothetical protein
MRPDEHIQLEALLLLLASKHYPGSIASLAVYECQRTIVEQIQEDSEYHLRRLWIG